MASSQRFLLFVNHKDTKNTKVLRVSFSQFQIRNSKLASGGLGDGEVEGCAFAGGGFYCEGAVVGEGYAVG